MALFGSSPVRALKLAGGLAVLVLVGGCFGSSESGTAPAETAWGQFLRGSSEPPKEVDPNLYRPIATCPPITVRSGTETHVIMQGPVGDPKSVGFQATLSETARECAFTDGQMALKVGVAGRLLAGRKGGSGSAKLPVRIVVLKDGEKPVYTKLHQVPVTLTAPASSTAWAFVDEFSVPNEGTLRILVGFDEGPQKPKPAEAATQ
jgi:hypothetical protein